MKNTLKRLALPLAIAAAVAVVGGEAQAAIDAYDPATNVATLEGNFDSIFGAVVPMGIAVIAWTYLRKLILRF